jgi:hypothetical protein
MDVMIEGKTDIGHRPCGQDALKGCVMQGSCCQACDPESRVVFNVVLVVQDKLALQGGAIEKEDCQGGSQEKYNFLDVCVLFNARNFHSVITFWL